MNILNGIIFIQLKGISTSLEVSERKVESAANDETLENGPSKTEKDDNNGDAATVSSQPQMDTISSIISGTARVMQEVALD